MPYKIQKQFRLKGWDYGAEGYYFVTICTKDRENFLGKIKDQEIKLSAVGILAQQFWLEIPKHFPNIELDYFVIMPNHIHGIIVIKGNDNKNNDFVGTGQCPVRNPLALENTRTGQCPVPTDSKFGHVKPQSLSTIIGSFKSISTKIIHQKYPAINFTWQPRFHDHIIRDEEELNNVRQYIEYNPDKWQWDKENIARLEK